MFGDSDRKSRACVILGSNQWRAPAAPTNKPSVEEAESEG